MLAVFRQFFLLFFFAYLEGCQAIAVDNAIKQGKSVVIFSGESSNTWVRKDNASPNPNFFFKKDNSAYKFKHYLNGNSASIKVIEPGTYVLYLGEWDVPGRAVYTLVPQYLKSSLGMTISANVKLQVGETKEIVQKQLPDLTREEIIYDEKGKKIGSKQVIEKDRGFVDMIQYTPIYGDGIQNFAMLTPFNSQGEVNIASFEVKAGEIIVLDKFFIKSVQRDLNNCKWFERETNNILNCPIMRLELTYIPSSHLKLDSIIEPLTKKQIKAIIKRPITLGASVRSTPVQIDEDGYDTYILNAEKTQSGDLKLIELTD